MKIRDSYPWDESAAFIGNKVNLKTGWQVPRLGPYWAVECSTGIQPMRRSRFVSISPKGTTIVNNNKQDAISDAVDPGGIPVDV